jgi:hypothetical protein
MTTCLAESVASRLRDHGFKCKTVQIYVRDNELDSFERQAKLQNPSQVSNDLLGMVMKLFEGNYAWKKPIRSVGMRGADLVSALGNKQLSFLDDDIKEEKAIRLESTKDPPSTFQVYRVSDYTVCVGFQLPDSMICHGYSPSAIPNCPGI